MFSYHYDTPTMGRDKHNRCVGENNAMGMGVRQETQEGKWAKGECTWYVHHFLFFTHFVDLFYILQARPINNLFWYDKEGCILLAMSIFHLNMTRRATTPLATSISDFSMTRRAASLLATSISHFSVTRRAVIGLMMDLDARRPGTPVFFYHLLYCLFSYVLLDLPVHLHTPTCLYSPFH